MVYIFISKTLLLCIIQYINLSKEIRGFLEEDVMGWRFFSYELEKERHTGTCQLFKPENPRDRGILANEHDITYTRHKANNWCRMQIMNFTIYSCYEMGATTHQVLLKFYCKSFFYLVSCLLRELLFNFYFPLIFTKS